MTTICRQQRRQGCTIVRTTPRYTQEGSLLPGLADDALSSGCGTTPTIGVVRGAAAGRPPVFPRFEDTRPSRHAASRGRQVDNNTLRARAHTHSHTALAARTARLATASQTQHTVLPGHPPRQGPGNRFGAELYFDNTRHCLHLDSKRYTTRRSMQFELAATADAVLSHYYAPHDFSHAADRGGCRVTSIKVYQRDGTRFAGQGRAAARDRAGRELGRH